MYFYLAMVGFEPTPTSTAAPSNTETTVIPSRPLRSLNKLVANAIDIYVTFNLLMVLEKQTFFSKLNYLCCPSNQSN